MRTIIGAELSRSVEGGQSEGGAGAIRQRSCAGGHRRSRKSRRSDCQHFALADPLQSHFRALSHAQESLFVRCVRSPLESANVLNSDTIVKQ